MRCFNHQHCHVDDGLCKVSFGYLFLSVLDEILAKSVNHRHYYVLDNSEKCKIRTMDVEQSPTQTDSHP